MVQDSAFLTVKGKKVKNRPRQVTANESFLSMTWAKALFRYTSKVLFEQEQHRGLNGSALSYLLPPVEMNSGVPARFCHAARVIPPAKNSGFRASTMMTSKYDFQSAPGTSENRNDIICSVMHVKRTVTRAIQTSAALCV
jgi:hypothetical protein